MMLMMMMIDDDDDDMEVRHRRPMFKTTEN